MMVYYKHYAESVLGEGMALMAVDTDEDQVVKQVEVYGDEFFWSDAEAQSDERFMLADQPASEIGLREDHQIEQSEFEEAWVKARSSCR